MRIHISQREAFESLEQWALFLLKHALWYDCLMLREDKADVASLLEIVKVINKPLILNTGGISKSLALGDIDPELERYRAFALHVKSSEVQICLKQGEKARRLLESMRGRYGLKLTTAVHSDFEAQQAMTLFDFDGYFISPIKATSCKPGVMPLSEAQCAQIQMRLRTGSPSLGLFALGGMKANDTAYSLKRGFDGIAGRNQFFEV